MQTPSVLLMAAAVQTHVKASAREEQLSAQHSIAELAESDFIPAVQMLFDSGELATTDITPILSLHATVLIGGDTQKKSATLETSDDQLSAKDSYVPKSQEHWKSLTDQELIDGAVDIIIGLNYETIKDLRQVENYLVGILYKKRLTQQVMDCVKKKRGTYGGPSRAGPKADPYIRESDEYIISTALRKLADRDILTIGHLQDRDRHLVKHIYRRGLVLRINSEIMDEGDTRIPLVSIMPPRGVILPKGSRFLSDKAIIDAAVLIMTKNNLRQTSGLFKFDPQLCREITRRGLSEEIFYAINIKKEKDRKVVP